LTTVPLDALADGAGLDGLTVAELAAVLARLGAIQARIAARLLDLNQAETGHPAAARLLDAQEAAARLGVSTTWLYRRARSLPFAVRLGGHLRFNDEEISRFIRSRTRGAARTRKPENEDAPATNRRA